MSVHQPEPLAEATKRAQLRGLIVGCSLFVACLGFTALGDSSANAKGQRGVNGSITATGTPPATYGHSAFPVTVSGEVTALRYKRRCEGNRRLIIGVWDPTRYQTGFNSQTFSATTDQTGSFSATVQYQPLADQDFYAVNARALPSKRKFEGRPVVCNEPVPQEKSICLLGPIRPLPSGSIPPPTCPQPW